MPALGWDERGDLAQRFAPHLVLFPEDQNRNRPGKPGDIGDYHPRGISPLLESSSISTGGWQETRPVTLDVLSTCTGKDAQLRLVGRLLPDPDVAWAKYFQILNRAGGRERFPVTVYARVQTRAEANAACQDVSNLGKDFPVGTEETGRPFFKSLQGADDDISIQYWLCYYYDDWANQHEGDWEGMCVFLRRTGTGYEPVGVSCYAHETGTRRHWAEVERTVLGGTHPIIYAAAGSHASYFQFVKDGFFTTVPGAMVPVLNLRLRLSVSSTRVDRVADKNTVTPLEPRVQMLPDPIGPADGNDSAWQHAKWLAFPGAWGVRVLFGFAYGGPTGPSHKGLKWHNPFAWMERYCSPDFLVY